METIVFICSSGFRSLERAAFVQRRFEFLWGDALARTELLNCTGLRQRSR